VKTAKKRGPQIPLPRARSRGKGPHNQTGKDTRILGEMTQRCPHCTTVTVHTILYCGSYRICQQCRTCGQHKRLGARLNARIERAA
jgi:hypothetical protein